MVALTSVDVASSGSVLSSSVRSATNGSKVASNVGVDARSDLDVNLEAVPVGVRVGTARVTSLNKIKIRTFGPDVFH